MKNRQEEMTPELATYVYTFWIILLLNTVGRLVVVLIANEEWSIAQSLIAIAINSVLFVGAGARMHIRFREKK